VTPCSLAKFYLTKYQSAAPANIKKTSVKNRKFFTKQFYYLFKI
jgi:hypothetical protein